MATVYSDEMVKVRAGRNLQSNQYQGKVRFIQWDFASLPAGNIGDVLVCGKIRKNEKVIHGFEFHTALTSGGATATGSYGTYLVGADGVTLGAVDNATRFLAATSMDGAGQTALNELQSIAVGTGPLFEATSTDLFLVCVNSVEAFATAGRVSGWLLVVAD